MAIPSVLGYVDEAKKKAGIIQEAHGIYEAAQIAATNAMQQMKMNLKNNQF